MRSIFVFIFILGLSPANGGETIQILQTSQAPIDHSAVTASITREMGLAERPTLVLKKTHRLRVEAAQNNLLLERMDISAKASE